jgi:hypothetical protein
LMRNIQFKDTQEADQFSNWIGKLTFDDFQLIWPSASIFYYKFAIENNKRVITFWNHLDHSNQHILLQYYRQLKL